MHLIDLLAPSRVVAGASVSSKKKLLDTLAGLLAEGGGPALERLVFDSLCGREKLGSTGLGHGVAIPHGRTAGLPAAIGAFVRLDEGIDFSALDSRPVDLVFALADKLDRQVLKHKEKVTDHHRGDAAARSASFG